MMLLQIDSVSMSAFDNFVEIDVNLGIAGGGGLVLQHCSELSPPCRHVCYLHCCV